MQVKICDNYHMNDKKIDDIIKEQEKRISELEAQIANQKEEFDKLEGKSRIQEMVIEELLDVIEKKEFQRVSQILRSYGIKSEKTDVLVNEAEIVKETTSKEEEGTAEEIENAIKNSNNKKKPGRKKGTHNCDGFDLSKIPTRDEYVESLDDVKCDICGEIMIENGEEIITTIQSSYDRELLNKKLGSITEEITKICGKQMKFTVNLQEKTDNVIEEKKSENTVPQQVNILLNAFKGTVVAGKV